MSMQVQSFCQHKVDIKILNGTTDSTPGIPFEPYAQGGFILPAAFTGTAVSFKVSVDKGTTYAPLYDSSNTLVSVTVTAARAYAFPISLFPFTNVIIVSNAAEGADRAISVSLKY